MKINHFKDAFKLINMLNNSEEGLIGELIVKDTPKFESMIRCSETGYNFSRELKTLESAAKIQSFFEAGDLVDISLDEILRYEKEIYNLEYLINLSPEDSQISIDTKGKKINHNTEIAVLMLITAPIGSHIFGLLISFLGKAEAIGEQRFRLTYHKRSIEKQIVLDKGEVIEDEVWNEMLKKAITKYSRDYLIVTNLEDKSIEASLEHKNKHN